VGESNADSPTAFLNHTTFCQERQLRKNYKVKQPRPERKITLVEDTPGKTEGNFTEKQRKVV